MTEERLLAINDTILAHYEKKNDDTTDDDDDDQGDGTANQGTLMLDATCAPSHIKYPQDISLLDEARRHAENIIDTLCEVNGWKKPRTYRRRARKDYLAIAKRRKKSKKVIRKSIRK